MSCYILQRGKPTLTRPREYLILERRKQEELREEANAMVNYNKQFDLKVCAATWIISTKSHSCHRAFLHWSICSRNHLGPHSATAIDKKFLFKWKNTVIPPFSTTRLTSCLHSILQCWLLSVLTHGNQSALQDGMGLACKTTLQHTHVSHSHARTQTKWEQSTDKKIERNTVQRRMEGLLRKQQFSLEERREKWATIGMFNLLFLCTKFWILIITNQFIAKFKNITMDQLNTSCDKREKGGIIPMAYPENSF